MALKAVLAICAACIPLAGCVTETIDGGLISGFPGFGGSASPSPQALAALPAGIDPAFLRRGDDGCWSIVLEEREPARGVPLHDAAGQPVCA